MVKGEALYMKHRLCQKQSYKTQYFSVVKQWRKDYRQKKYTKDIHNQERKTTGSVIMGPSQHTAAIYSQQNRSFQKKV